MQIGAIAGRRFLFAAIALRSSGLELLGSGMGSVALSVMLACAGESLAIAGKAGFDSPVTVLPLERVEDAWTDDPHIRYVLVPER